MTKYSKTSQGEYIIKGQTYKQLAGSRAQVNNKTAYKTSGGLKKEDLVYINGRVKSKSKHISASKEQRLLKHGYGAQKGTFGNIKLHNITKKRRSK
jgi:hypothetical protein